MTEEPTTERMLREIGRALERDLGVAGIVALTRLQASPYEITYRGQEIPAVLALIDPQGMARTLRSS